MKVRRLGKVANKHLIHLKSADSSKKNLAKRKGKRNAKKA